MMLKKWWVGGKLGLANSNANDDQIQKYYAFQTFSIMISHLYNPLFQRLLDKASEINGSQTSFLQFGEEFHIPYYSRRFDIF
ncbi:hypothetical protein ACS0TY_023291 [Phlomoides rotata]